jgi:hypothetical protein
VWILANLPWSQIRPFPVHAFTLANNVIFLMTVNHAWTKAWLREMKNRGSGLCEILLVPTPASYPPTGFQLGAVHNQRGYRGPIASAELQ